MSYTVYYVARTLVSAEQRSFIPWTMGIDYVKEDESYSMYQSRAEYRIYNLVGDGAWLLAIF